jgi:hypothetical protein
MRNAVKVVVEIHPEWSDRMVGELVGVHGETVASCRQLPNSGSSILRNPRQSNGFGPPPTPPLRIGRDGKFRRAPPVKVKPPVPVRAGQAVGQSAGERETVTSEQSAVQDPLPVPKPPAEPAGDEAIGLVDALGRHVPEDLAPLWHRRKEVQEALTAISRVRSTIRNAQDSHDPLWAEINFSSALALLDRVYTEVDSTKPYVVCPMCQGIGCRACKERGLLGKYRYETVIPRELKNKAPQRGA